MTERETRDDDLVDVTTAAQLLEVTEDRIDVLVADGLLDPEPGEGERLFSRAAVAAVRNLGG